MSEPWPTRRSAPTLTNRILIIAPTAARHSCGGRRGSPMKTEAILRFIRLWRELKPIKTFREWRRRRKERKRK